MSSLGTSVTSGPTVPVSDDDDGEGGGKCGAVSGMRIGGENQSTWKKPAPSVTLSITNPTWTDLESNQARPGGKPAIDLSYGTALFIHTFSFSRKDLNRVIPEATIP